MPRGQWDRSLSKEQRAALKKGTNPAPTKTQTKAAAKTATKATAFGRGKPELKKASKTTIHQKSVFGGSNGGSATGTMSGTRDGLTALQGLVGTLLSAGMAGSSDPYVVTPIPKMVAKELEVALKLLRRERITLFGDIDEEPVATAPTAETSEEPEEEEEQDVAVAPMASAPAPAPVLAAPAPAPVAPAPAPVYPA